MASGEVRAIRRFPLNDGVIPILRLLKVFLLFHRAERGADGGVTECYCIGDATYDGSYQLAQLILYFFFDGEDG